MTDNVIFFTGARIDRADALRGDADALDRAMRDPAARALRLDGLDPVAPTERLEWVPLDIASGRDHALLGLCDATPLFVRIPTHPTDGRQRGAIDRVTALPPTEAALYALARSLADWHARNGFCGACGGRTRLAKGGWMRGCDRCAAQHFPRVDPVVIMLALHPDGDRVLLGRSHGFAPRRMTALAGFVEPGESIEEAAARELFEETGIPVVNMRYVASQPWPYPSSLMIACVGTATDDAIVLDATELDDARWIDRDTVRRALAGDPDAFDPPPPHAIARLLIERWADGAFQP